MDGPLVTALIATLAPATFGFIALGVVLGCTVGAIPGLTGAMLIALTLPMTYYMDSVNAMTLLVSMYVGAVSGGLISATLLRMPGTPGAIMTTLDGFPMAKAGRPGRAIGFGVMASFLGGMVSWVFLAVLSPPLAKLAVRFGPFEYFSMVLMALVLIAQVSSGALIKGLIAGFIGMLAAMPGLDPSSGVQRLGAGSTDMIEGFRLLPVLLGVFAVSQIIADVVNIAERAEQVKGRLSGMFMSLADLRRQTVNILRSSVIGTWIGILPGIGATIGAIISYTVARNVSRHPERFGTGCEDGIVASETANNATVNGALVPLITLGIPGSTVDAILLGALLIHNLTPGPLLFVNNPEIAYGIIAAALTANFVMLAFMLGATRFLARLMYVPKALLLPVILAFCFLGAFAVGNRMFDVWVMLGFGVVTYLLSLAGIPRAPFVIGYVLAPVAESQLRAGLMLSHGSFAPIFTRPISLGFVVVALLILLWPLFKKWYDASRPQKFGTKDAADT